jgi:hypothetical protein
MTQGVDWAGSSVELQYSNQRGSIYVTHANTDFEFEVGGIAMRGGGGATVMFGIAALNSSGTGVGIVVYTDNNAYLATITTYVRLVQRQFNRLGPPTPRTPRPTTG